MEESTPVTDALDTASIPYRFFRHPGKVSSLEQAAQERGQRPEQVIRTIVFRLSRDEFVLVLVAGPEQVSWSALRTYLGKSRLTLADQAEILALTGYPIGAVSPLGLPHPMRTLVDRSVLQDGEISIGSGERHTTVILQAQDLMETLGQVEIGDFVKRDGSN